MPSHPHVMFGVRARHHPGGNSRWPARMDWAQSVSGLLLGLNFGGVRRELAVGRGPAASTGTSSIWAVALSVAVGREFGLTDAELLILPLEFAGEAIGFVPLPVCPRLSA